jgi:hypothetical protein
MYITPMLSVLPGLSYAVVFAVMVPDMPELRNMCIVFSWPAGMPNRLLITVLHKHILPWRCRSWLQLLC